MATIQGCESASVAEMRLCGSSVRKRRMRFLASMETLDHTSE